MDRLRGGGLTGVLVVDDDRTFLETVSAWLQLAGRTVAVAETTRQALLAARLPALSLALIDYRLQDRVDGIRLGYVLRRRLGLPFALVSGYLNTDLVVAAMSAGAIDVIDKPLTQRRLQALLERSAMASQARFRLDTAPANISVETKSIALRWAHMVLKGCQSPEDLRTVAIWGRVIGMSPTTVDENCRLCDVTALDSRDLGRFLRAVRLSRARSWPLSQHFAVADDRTLERLFQRAGLPRNCRSVGLQELLTKQSFISMAKPCLRELAHLAANSPLFFGVN